MKTLFFALAFGVYIGSMSSSLAWAKLEASCNLGDSGAEIRASKIVVVVEIDPAGTETLTLRDIQGERVAQQSWTVRKELIRESTGVLKIAHYYKDEANGDGVSLAVDMTKKFEYAVHPSVLEVFSGGQIRTEKVVCGFFYQFP